MTVSFAELTTIRVGGAPNRLIPVTSESELIDAARDVWASGEPWLLLGGGSNTVVGDDGFDGTVIHIASRGVEVLSRDSHTVRLRVQAGEPWDALVALSVTEGWSGIEALSGIPGSTGAAPVQNIGAYGQEIAQVLTGIDFLDYETGEIERVPASELGLGYRTSTLKQGRLGVVLAVEMELTDNPGVGLAPSRPIQYTQLADTLGVHVGTSVSVAELRRTVLSLRRSKGMVLDPDDPDTASAGSFFTNPIVTENFARGLPAELPRWPMTSPEPDVKMPLDAAGSDGRSRLAQPPHLVKLSAAWLIEHSGITRGYRLPGSKAAISSKHTLAITNTGGATAADILELARFVQGRVQAEHGVILQPEPVVIGGGL